MPTPIANGPTVTELARRLQRIEDKLDERTATVDMLRSLERSVGDRLVANEKLAEAREVNHQATVVAVAERVGKVEDTHSRIVVAIVVVFLGLVVNLIVYLVGSTGGRAVP